MEQGPTSKTMDIDVEYALETDIVRLQYNPHNKVFTYIINNITQCRYKNSSPSIANQRKKLIYCRDAHAMICISRNVGLMFTNNANRSRVSLRSTFSNCHVLFRYLHIFMCVVATCSRLNHHTESMRY